MELFKGDKILDVRFVVKQAQGIPREVCRKEKDERQ
jgi:hypothetical protein